MSNPFAHLDPRTRGLLQVVDAKLALDQQANAPPAAPAPDPVRRQPRPPSWPDDNGVPQRGPKLDPERLQFLTNAMRDGSGMQAAQITIAAAKARGEIDTAKPATVIAQAFIDAANKARQPAQVPELPPEGSLARQIIDAAAKAVNWAR